MAEILKVEPEELNAMAGRFEGRAEQIQAIMQSFTATVTLIQSAAFLGHVGDAANEKYINEFQPRLTVFQQKMTEISEDLKQTVADYIAEDEQASAFFQDGGGGGGGGGNVR